MTKPGKLFFLKALLLAILCCFEISTYSQIPLQGEWRDHLSYRHGMSLADQGDKIYYAAEAGIITYNKNLNELKAYSKVNGLSDVLISTLAYAEASDAVIIGYQNGNIDIIHDDADPVNITDIKRKIITADKRINQIFINGSTAYLACGFGIVVLNLERNEIKETYILGESGAYIEIKDVCIVGNTLYALTPNGIFQADLNNSNLLDFSYWSKIDFLPESDDISYDYIEAFNNNLFVVYSNSLSGEDVILTIANNSYSVWNHANGKTINGIHASNGYLCISANDRALVYNSNSQLYAEGISYDNRQVLVSKEGQIFIASGYGGFLRMDNPNAPITWLTVDGPRFSEVAKITTYEDQVWVTSGGPNRLYKHGAIHSFIDEKWNSITTENTYLDTLGNTYKIAIDPLNPNHLYVGTYGYGILEILDNELIAQYDLGTHPIFDGIDKVVGIRVSGIQFDKAGNLFFVLDNVPSPFFKIDVEGNWSRIPTNSSLMAQSTNYADMLITSRNQIWLLSRQSGMVVLEDEGDDTYRHTQFPIKNQKGHLLSRGFCLAEDNEGNIVIGTDNGPATIYSPLSVFDNEIPAYQVTIEREDDSGYVDFLLYTETILDIAIDGGNQKWVATDQSGVFLISEDGQETLLNFREENSPLLSNGVTGVGVNHKSGEVFFATDLGLVSYGGIATKGAKNFSDVYAYPNPVHPDYDGPITIAGLMENTVVKITDVSGDLVWETKSFGGQAVWDGRNFNGNKVATGVYLVMLATEDALSSHITKILFLH